MILRIGSNGSEVRLLQEFLNNNGFVITKTGPGSPGRETEIFGELTDRAVKRWQAQNLLTPDGIVGPKTLTAMGLLTTDSSEQTEPIFYEKNFLNTKEYFAGPTNKEWVFLHHTAGWHSPVNVITGWNTDTIGLIATEFVLGGQSIRNNDNTQDGRLVQAFPKGGYAWHLGTGNNEMHRNSVGIELCNFGYLEKDGFHRWDVKTKRNVWIPREKNKFYTYVGTEADPNQIIELKSQFRGFKFWHRYSDRQITVLKDWILYIANRDSIDVRKGLPELIKQRGVAAFDVVDIPLVTRTKGLWNHTNVRRDKFDLFPQEELIDMLLSL
jgi:hypothetical protein